MLHPEQRKENLKKIAYDELRKELGFSEMCGNCKRNVWACERDRFYSLEDFCLRLDMAIETILERDKQA